MNVRHGNWFFRFLYFPDIIDAQHINATLKKANKRPAPLGRAHILLNLGMNDCSPFEKSVHISFSHLV